jgi:hypothetical protein
MLDPFSLQVSPPANVTFPQCDMQVCFSLFLDRGYAASSLREIAEACDIDKATIDHHFPDR